MDEIKLLLTKYNKVHLAKKLGVTRGTIYNYVDGVHKPSLDVYLRILALIKEIDTNTPGGDFTGAGEDDLITGR